MIMGQAKESTVPELGHKDDYCDECCQNYRLKLWSAHEGSIG